MASFWDKVKQLFGEEAKPAESALEQRVRGVVNELVEKRNFFTAAQVADRATRDDPSRTQDDLRDATRAAEALLTEAYLTKNSYGARAAPAGTLFLPVSASPQPSAPPANVVAPPQRNVPAPFAPQPTIARPAPAPAAAIENPFRNEAILGLSADELRKRALKINPHRTAWIGRVDTIPPQSDERTALIDRGLVLRGLLTVAQLEEIHRVGDLWIRFHEVERFANTVATQSAEQAVEAFRREKAERKARKKLEAEQRRVAREAAIADRKANDIIFLGPGVSGLLHDRRLHLEKLQANALPILTSPKDVAAALQLPVPRLRWLCFHGEVVERSHYVYFEVPKRSGGKRLLASPHTELRKAQSWILENVLAKLQVEPPAHGFVGGRSTLSNALPHLGKDLVVNLDLSDFFPTITFPRVRGLFQGLGYSPAVATLLALLCTESPRRKVEYDGKPYWVAVGARGLPQGACTSPAISNLIARKLDRRLAGFARKKGWTYTRYADDLTFSAPEGKRAELPLLLARVRHLVQDEGFALNPKKGRVQRVGGRQTVTGIVVNEKPGLPREEVRRLRAILHAAKKTGLEAQNKIGHPHFESYLRGKIAYLHMVDAKKAAALKSALDALV